MKIVIAPDSFKESLTAQQVAEAIKRGFQQSIADVECLLCPVGDGGEGTVDSIRHSLDLEEKWIQVTGPCLLYTSPSPRDRQKSRMPSSA